MLLKSSIMNVLWSIYWSIFLMHFLLCKYSGFIDGMYLFFGTELSIKALDINAKNSKLKGTLPFSNVREALLVYRCKSVGKGPPRNEDFILDFHPQLNYLWTQRS